MDLKFKVDAGNPEDTMLFLQDSSCYMLAGVQVTPLFLVQKKWSNVIVETATNGFLEEGTSK